MHYFSADYIFTGNGPLLKAGIVATNNDGLVLEVFKSKPKNLKREEIRHYRGIICPGFINTHCHLELSYLKGKIKANTQLHGFINDLMSVRENFTQIERESAMIQAENEMIKNGIVAVGDIANGSSTFSIKEKSSLYYHTFIEVFGSDPNLAKDAFSHSENLFNTYFNSSAVSITPHATYSVSAELSRLIHQHNVKHNSILSIHNQETQSENEFHKNGSGKLFEFLKIAEKTKGKFIPSGLNALPSFLQKYSNESKITLIHNTFTDYQDIQWTKNFSSSIYWTFCPNANMYIENTLPDFTLFLNEKCCIGTDSLASNNGLSVLEELKTISKHFPDIPLETLLKWATVNGAELLSIHQKFGTIEVGKKPGINLIENLDLENFKLTPDSKVVVLL